MLLGKASLLFMAKIENIIYPSGHSNGPKYTEATYSRYDHSSRVTLVTLTEYFRDRHSWFIS